MGLAERFGCQKTAVILIDGMSSTCLNFRCEANNLAAPTHPHLPRPFFRTETTLMWLSVESNRYLSRTYCVSGTILCTRGISVREKKRQDPLPHPSSNPFEIRTSHKNLYLNAKKIFKHHSYVSLLLKMTGVRDYHQNPFEILKLNLAFHPM